MKKLYAILVISFALLIGPLALSFMVFADANTALAEDAQHQSLMCSGASLSTPGVIQPGTYESW